MEKKVFKFITVDQLEKEQDFLHNMVLEGWHFSKYKNFQYKFEQGKPANYVYRIDYKETLEDLDEYLAIFEDAGWEAVYSYPIFQGSWIYFRKLSTDETQNLEIFTDKDSMIGLLKKVRMHWTWFGMTMSFILLFLLLSNLFTTRSLISGIPLTICFLIILILYGKLFFNLTKKINQLEQT
ncbi:MAG: DUF2812 domain-containing protein [Carnobacterium sp.]|uniref:DUF2812 domain-containing protein n=1 Tax=Carnobacterium sp. TaxID=48221 RepID=UPI002FCBEB4F